MSISGSHRHSLVVIPFLQKRLRRITSMGLSNLTINDRYFHIYFTLHRFDRSTSKSFYTSESLENDRNPEWTNLKFPGDSQCLQEFRIDFWLKIDETSRLIFQIDVFLEKNLRPEFENDSNSFWFEMFGHRFGDVSKSIDEFSSFDSSRLTLVKSSNRSSLCRIFNLLDAIRNEENLAKKSLRDVENFIENQNEILSKIVDRESREIRLKILRQCLTNETSKIRQRRFFLNEKRKFLNERREILEYYRSRLLLQRESVDELLNCVEESRSDLQQIKEMIEHRRKSLLNDIFKYIYPIETNGENLWTIVKAKLPSANEKIFQNASILSRDKEIAGGLIFSSHLVLLISNLIDLPLRYPIESLADGTIRISDLTLQIQHFLLDPSTDLNAFRYAFYLLNRNIGQILFHYRIPTRRIDFRRTLENLKLFFDFLIK